MSGAARRRGRGRAQSRGQSQTPDTSSQLVVPVGGFDGPASRGSGSATSGRAASTGSGRGEVPQPAAAPPPRADTQSTRLRHDPALDPDRVPLPSDALKNIDLPASLFNLFDHQVDTAFLSRPGFNTTGKKIQLAVNALPVMRLPTAKVYQYNVTIGDGAEKRIVNRKVWDSRARKNATGPDFIWDGNKLAWSLKPFPEISVMVDLDVEEGNQSRGGRNTFRVRLKQTTICRPDLIQAFFDGKHIAGNEVNTQLLEALNFLDHLIRETPSNNPELVPVKRAFFSRQAERKDLGCGIEVFRGVYQSLRLAQGGRMVINVDVANTTFWKPTSLLSAMITNNELRDVHDLDNKIKTDKDNGSRVQSKFSKAASSRFKGVMCKAHYQGNPFPNKEWKIFRFAVNNANEEMLEWKDPQTKQPTGQMITVNEYFRRKYNLRLAHPTLPLVEMTKKSVKYPLEFLHLLPHQRYGAKLNDTMTANMIKFAVSPPEKRLQAIRQGQALLNWPADPMLKKYELNLGTDTIKTNAVLLPPPSIEFGPVNKPVIENPGTRGRWDLRGKQFYMPNDVVLNCWGIAIVPGPKGKIAITRDEVERFVQTFVRQYRAHGGKINNDKPYIDSLRGDVGDAVYDFHQATGNRFGARPQFLMFIVPNRDSFTYLRIKKSADCRFGVVTQVLQMFQVQKAQGQYISNVLMKVNAKLGGCTSKVKPSPASGFSRFGGPTVFIGADVSHPSPGSTEPSMAALTVSYDKFAGRYAAAVESNGHRAEMITRPNMSGMLVPLLNRWVSQVGGNNVPKQVFYMRDGVSEGQFRHVLEREVPALKEVLQEVNGGKPWTGNLTVIVASKRHHIRAFPQSTDRVAGDPKHNPVPGVLVERDVTMPNEFDFYLYSHIALQGTSRPVHYTVLLDDANHKPEQLQNMIYEHCYQYMRSTTSVSLHPAIYYAHLASNRAKSHVDISSAAGPQAGPGFKQNQPHSGSNPASEIAPLIPMYNVSNIRYSMWYI